MRFEVVLDTSALRGAGWTEVGSTDTKRLAREAPKGVELRVVTPRISRDERCYQMTEAVLEAARKARSLAAVVGGDVPDDETLRRRTSERVDRQLAELGIHVVPLNYASVSLEQIVTDAVDRVAPFESGSEKGFRDRIFLETAVQIVKANENSGIATLVVTADDRLHGALVRRTKGMKEVQILGSVADAITHLQAAAAHLENVDALRTEAAEVFRKLLESDVAPRITRDFAEQLLAPEGKAVRREIGFHTSDPALIGVGLGNRYFVTEVIVLSRVTRVYDEWLTDYDSQVYELSGVIEAGPIVFSEAWFDRFEVKWAAHYGDAGKLTGARVESIAYLGRQAPEPSR